AAGVGAHPAGASRRCDTPFDGPQGARQSRRHDVSADQPSAPTASAMMAVPSQPSAMTQKGSAKLASAALRRATSIIANITGTETMPLMTAAQNSMAIGLRFERARAAPASVAALTIA